MTESATVAGTSAKINIKGLIIGLIFALVLATLIVYSPSLSQPPLFDETFLLAWLSNCIKSGLFSGATGAYLTSQAADPRDGLTALGSGMVLLTALLTGTTYGLMRFLQIILHLSNAVLLMAAVCGACRPNNGDFTAGGTATVKALSLGAAAALLFCIFPLAPETVSWLYGLPIEFATTFMLAASAILVWQDQTLSEVSAADNEQVASQNHNAAPTAAQNAKQNPDINRVAGRNRNGFIIAATILGVIAPWVSLKGALLVNLPLILLLTRYGLKGWFKEASLKPILISLALMILSSVPAEIVSLSGNRTVPEAVKQLTIEKVALTRASDPDKDSILETGPATNLIAVIMPVNRNIDERYNKVLHTLYLFLPLPLVLFLAAVITNPRFRLFGGLTVAAMFVWALGSSATINAQSFYGARWLYPILPTACLLWAMICASPLFIEIGKRQKSSAETAEVIIKVALCGLFVFSLSLFLFQRTYRQNMSFKSNGKLWNVIKESINIAGQKQSSPFVIVRNLPQSLSIAPILSPFSPQLIDAQSGLPRTASLSAGRLKEALRNGRYTGVTLHYEKQFDGFVATDLAISTVPFGPEINAKKIAEQLAPPIYFYNGAVKLDDKMETLLMQSHSRVGPALRMASPGLSPLQGDFLYVDAKIDVPQAVTANSAPRLELHWLTNWLGDWEARDRRVLATGPVSDGQFHRYYFPLRTLAWTTSGLPTYIMLGFPGGATVQLRSIGVSQEPIPLPDISISAVRKQNPNTNHFSHYCFNYPDMDDLGLAAVYGMDNALDINFDVSKIDGAKAALIEVVPLSEAFRNENSTETVPGSIQIANSATKGNIQVKPSQLAGDGLYSVRVFATGADNKPLGHASDSLKCLVDQHL